MKINVYCWVDADASDQIETRNENLKFNKTLKLDDIKSFYRMKYFQMFLPPKRAHFFKIYLIHPVLKKIFWRFHIWH